jgi:3-phenylpropionate/cinnamic acid dioxygenase small subunit
LTYSSIHEGQIEHLLAAYCHALDERNFEIMAELFTEDAVVTARIAGGAYRGRNAICEYLKSHPTYMRGLHLTVNPEIDVDDNGGIVRSDFVVISPRPSESLVVAWGWYRDLVIKEDGRWRFRERHIETQWRTEQKGADDPFRRLSDELEIRNLVARIAQTADMAENLDDYLACFTKDAVWEFGGNSNEGLDPVRVVGHESLRADRLERRARGVQGPGTPNRHVITTLAVDVGDDDTARTDSYFLLMADTTSDPRIRTVGHYLDHFVRTAEGWKLTSRQIKTG